MSEQQVVGNPFDDANFVSGGGLWDGKTVTIISAKAVVDRLLYGDGKPVINESTGEPAIRNVLEIIGIADDEEKERRETYSTGALVPTADGDGFVKVDGTPGAFHSNSEVAKLSRYLKQSGFDIASLWNASTQRQTLRPLAGARFVFKGEPRLDKDGKPKTNKKGYTENRFYPVKFVGYKAGQQAPTASAPVSASSLTEKAQSAIVAILADAGGPVTRSEMVRKLAANLSGDPDANKVIALFAKDDFHKGAPWTRNGTTYNLGA